MSGAVYFYHLTLGEFYSFTYIAAARRPSNALFSPGTRNISEEVDLSDMTEEVVSVDGIIMSCFTWLCRCGGTYAIWTSDLESGVEVVGCDSCSLHIKVVYEEVVDSAPAE